MPTRRHERPARVLLLASIAAALLSPACDSSGDSARSERSPAMPAGDLPVTPTSLAKISCPPMPQAVTQVNRDVKSEISASVASLGRVKAGEIGTKTEVAASNLFSKYPNVDKLLALQTMASTYCTMLQSSSLPDSERIDRWERFQEKVLQLQTSPQLAPAKVPAQTPSSASAGRTDSLRALEAKIGPSVAEECTRLARWPSDGATGKDILKKLLALRPAVEDTPGIFDLKSATIADLYRCLGGARLVSEGALPEKISGALPYLKQSLRFNPSQPLLEKNVGILETFLEQKGGDAKVFFVAILQTTRNTDDPDIHELAERMVEISKPKN